MKYYYHPEFHELWPAESPSLFSNNTVVSNAPANLGIERQFLLEDIKSDCAPFFILPDLSPHLIIHQFKDGQLKFRVVGPRTHAVRVNRQRRHTTLILRFRPSYFNQFCTCPIEALRNQAVGLDDIMGASFNAQLLDQFAENSKELVFDLIEKGLAERMDAGRNGSKRKLPDFGTAQTVKAAAKQIGISERYLQKISIQQFGLPPKMVLKIQRFSRSLRCRKLYPEYSWSQIAHMAGYFDQSHMIDEYQQFLKRTPGQLIL